MIPFYLLIALYASLGSLLLKESLAIFTMPSSSCGLLEEFRQCGPKCPISCTTLNRSMCCDVVCSSGCFCKDGYMLVSNHGPRKCVAINDCPKPGTFEFRYLTVTVLENAKVVVITILRRNGSYGDVEVSWRTVAGTANEQSDFIPSSGILSFPDGVTARTIEIRIVDDNIRELEEFFTVKLYRPSNKAEINAKSQEGAKVIIKDDDMNPGYIEFDLVKTYVWENIEVLNVSLIRVGGTDGVIRTKFQTVDGTARAESDYVPGFGEVVFNEGESRKFIVLRIIDDDLREPAESFELRIFDVTPGPGVINFRSLGSKLAITIIIKDNDMNPGFIQFDLDRIEVLENIGVLNVPLVRLGGTDGLIRTKFRNEDGTAKSESDYVPAIGEVIFNDGESRKFISIRIIDDDLREPVESFELRIFDVTPGPGVINFRSLGSKLAITVIIKDNDMKPGYIEFGLVRTEVLENIGVLNVPLVRLGGTDGLIRMQFRTVNGTARAQTDYVPAIGEVIFNDGESRKFIPLRIIDDDVREPTESFELRISDVTPGPGVLNFRSLGSKMAINIIIKDNDMKPGYIEFGLVRTEVLENIGVLNVPLVRLGGTDGLIRMQFRTVNGTARAEMDYVPAIGEVVFNDGESRKFIPLRIIDDDVREPTESFELRISDVTPGPGVLNFRSLGTKLAIDIIIKDNDMKPGYIEFGLVRTEVLENIGVLNVPLVRLGGTDGLIRMQFRTVDGTAMAETDYVPANGEVIFNDGESRKFIPLRIIDDDVREPTESFELRISDVTPGPGVLNFRSLGSKLAINIIIKDNDMKPGYIEFGLVRTEVLENIGVLNVPLVRLGGTDGLIRMQFRTVDGTARAQTDYVPANGEVVFNDGESRKFIPLRIIDDDVREPTESFELRISDVTPGPGVLNFRSLGSKLAINIFITDNDMNPGYIEFELIRIEVSENIGVLNVTLIRRGGTDGLIRMQFRTADGTARAESDYVPAIGGVIFNDGESRKSISLKIIDDDLREPVESFELRIFDVTPGPGVINFRSLGSKLATTITITDNDMKPGFVELSKPIITIPESIGIITINVVRMGGKDGEIRVRYQTVDGSATATSDFVFQSGELVFRDGETLKTVTISIVNDNVRESTENFLLELFEESTEPVIVSFRSLGRLSSTTISILDDDENPGIFEFKDARLSVPEDIGTVRLTILRKKGSDGLVNIQVRTRDQSATKGVDYLSPPGTVIFQEGVLERTVDIQITDDDIVEGTEEFLVGIFRPTNGGNLGDVTLITISILDNDDPSFIRFERRSSSVREDVGFIEVPVVRENSLLREVSVSWRIVDSSAIAGVDYRDSRQSLLTFEPGENRKIIRIEIIDDTRYEATEKFDVVLFSPSRGSALGTPSRHTVEITDDDVQGSTKSSQNLPNLPKVSQDLQIFFRQSNIRIREDAGEVRIPIARSGGLGTFTVQIITEDLSASGGSDYRRIRGPVPFQEGDVEVTIAIKIINDDMIEPDETFLVKLFDASLGTISSSLSVVTVTIVDDDFSGRLEARSGGTIGNPVSPRPPTPKPVPGPLLKCPDHLILKVCADTCPPTCNSQFGKVPCSANGCIKGCFCPDGLVKESELSDKCIRPSQCPGAGGGGCKHCSNGGLSLLQSSGLLGGILGS